MMFRHIYTYIMVTNTLYNHYFTMHHVINISGNVCVNLHVCILTFDLKCDYSILPLLGIALFVLSACFVSLIGLNCKYQITWQHRYCMKLN